ncbi:TetR family transcriptional regulator [Nocardia brasiliensis]|uniref:TetR family transcriptional regulator n=1 Tax=Nocardia brasiliensis TaxID=37326 RepID=A0A6G9XR16_NOCBR|nr:TetR/AcrR family transcriptional regulator [Nocardia brasiliensis]QIS03345.1 TetR family transcriptional regulator [Nocardia brasiliensis]
MPTTPATTPGRATRRTERRAETIAEIKTLARGQLATEGTGGLSLRGIARAMRMSPAAIFRYFDNQSALITALCVDAYDGMADAIVAAQRDAAPEPAAQWRAGCDAARQWSLHNRADFTLINGTPVPGHQALPEETGPAASRTVVALGTTYLAAIGSGVADPDRTVVPALPIGPLMSALLGNETLPDTPVPGIVLNAWASILGFLSAEIFGSLTDLIPDTDALWDSHVTTVMRGMGFQQP